MTRSKRLSNMIDREKLIKGLACCDNMENDGQYLECDQCPYNDDMELGTCLSLTTLHRDAHDLLKADQTELIRQRDIIAQLQATLDLANGKLINMGYEPYDCDDGRQALNTAVKAALEPRVMTLLEVEDYVGYFSKNPPKSNEKLPLWTESKAGTGVFSGYRGIGNIRALIQTSGLDRNYIHNKHWRCWSSKPTDEQMEAMKWND